MSGKRDWRRELLGLSELFQPPVPRTA